MFRMSVHFSCFGVVRLNQRQLCIQNTWQIPDHHSLGDHVGFLKRGPCFKFAIIRMIVYGGLPLFVEMTM